MTNTDAALAAYVSGLEERMDDLVAGFLAEGFVELPEFGPPEVGKRIADDVLRLLDERGEHRQVTIASTGHTPRHMEVVGRDAIVDGSAVIPETYHSPAFRDFLARLTKEPEIIPVPYAPEEMVISRLSQQGETHGWHWDDYPYAVVWIVDAPPSAEDGGSLEYVRGTHWDKERPRVEEQLRTGVVERRHPAPGSIYLFKADTSMHRVAPLVADGVQRVIVCFSYATAADLERAVTHETVDFYS